MKYNLFHDVITIIKSTIFKLKTININIYIFKLFYNLNFNHSFNQTPIFSNQPQLKVLFIK